jgi:hypothetical protein
VARLITQVARALQPLHTQGIYHGDLKLPNLFVRTAPHGGPLAAISDFGQAVVIAAAANAAMTRAPDPHGWARRVLQCAAPEQITGQALPASDQYALATIAYVLLTGHYPFSGDAHTLAHAIVNQQPAAPSHIDPTLPPLADAALLRGLAKDPATRFHDVATFAETLSDGLVSGMLSTSVTQQFAQLAGANPRSSSVTHRPAGPNYRPTGGPSATGTALRIPNARPTAVLARADAELAGPGRLLPPSRQRLVAVVAVVAVLALAIGAFFSLRALFPADSPSRSALPNFGGQNYAPTVTPDATAIAILQQRAAVGQLVLNAALSQPPVFTDTLATNTSRWPVDGTTFFFAGDGKLHGTNHTSQAVASLNQPGVPPSNYVVSVNMTFLKGEPSDMAGLRVRVVTTAAGTVAHDTVLIAPEGRYEIWRYTGIRWVNLETGYSNAIKRGLNASNQLQILCNAGHIWLFVNGQFVAEVPDSTSPLATTTLGPTVIYTSTEVTYDHYGIYRVTP